MDITRSVVTERDRALLGGDYSAYHAQATRKIHALRKSLGIATPRNRKYTPKAAVTADNVARDTRWVQLLLASAERSWADAMAMKSSQSFENTQKSMQGSTKRQIASRMRRAILYAGNLVTVLLDQGTTQPSKVDVLEAQAYLSLLKGGLDFEKARWTSCIQNYSVARMIYATLGSTSKTEMYKDLLSGIVDPSIRYAAYQQKLPRTKPVTEIAVEGFPSAENDVRKEIESIDAQAFDVNTEKRAVADTVAKDLPSTIQWRSRKVKLEDATIAQAMGAAQSREQTLSATYATFQQGKVNAKDMATAYEDVITARQDVVDATKTAIDEMATEGVDQGDARMQSLQVTRTAVNYEVIEWRIGRNRILCGSQDGLPFQPEEQKQLAKPRKEGNDRLVKDESSGRKLSRLRERVALYDSILQSLDAVKELPGVIADSAFVDELDGKRSYFRALKCLAIGRSHAIGDHISNALALYARAAELSRGAQKGASSTTEAASKAPPKLDLSAAQLTSATTQLSGLVTQYQALSDLQLLALSHAKETEKLAKPLPLIQRLHLHQYDEQVDLTNLVTYPPKLQPVPVKPLFFDLAWNYIDYPGRASGRTENGAVVQGGGSKTSSGKKKVEEGEKEQEKENATAKKRWFGFGR